MTFRQLNGNLVKNGRNLRLYLDRMNTPFSGEEVLPQTVLEVVGFIRTKNISSFQISEKMASDSWVYQQIIASAWPAQLVSGASPFYFMLRSEKVPHGCAVREEKREVILVACP